MRRTRSRAIDAASGHLFDDAGLGTPEGFEYRRAFLSLAEAGDLEDALAALPLSPARYREFSARRRVVHFGYDFSAGERTAADPLPAFLIPLRARLALWAGLDAESFVQATIAEYPPGTPLGWHRDVPDFRVVAGVSLAGVARMRFRPYPPERGMRARLSIDLEPRSAYLIRGAARWHWQHAISPTPARRYSITLRTLRADAKR
jgi:alkylated DNA repair dioxygenase AlkB